MHLKIKFLFIVVFSYFYSFLADSSVDLIAEYLLKITDEFHEVSLENGNVETEQTKSLEVKSSEVFHDISLDDDVETDQTQTQINLLQKIVSAKLDTVFIFDWDDTLLASTYLVSKGYKLKGSFERDPLVENQLSELGKVVAILLNHALQIGKVFIITNAEYGWVQLSAQKFIPALRPILDKISIISARTNFESAHPDKPLQWKYLAFEKNLNTYFKASPVILTKNIISLGDSHVEREAVKLVGKLLDNTRTKSIKLATRPTIEQLKHQLNLLISNLHYLLSYEGDLDLMLNIVPQP